MLDLEFKVTFLILKKEKRSYPITQVSSKTTITSKKVKKSKKVSMEAHIYTLAELLPKRILMILV